MNVRYRSILKWTLYSLGCLLVALISTAALGDRTFFGAKVSLLPVYAACVACREGHEAGGFFALGCSLAWALSGASGGAIFVLLLPAAAIVSGFFCTTYLTPSLMPSCGGCALALVLCEGGVYLQRTYMDMAMPPDALRLLGITLVLSLLTAPVQFALVWLLGKAGDRR